MMSPVGIDNPTGNFEKDYARFCAANGVQPYRLRKLRYPLPPLPIPSSTLNLAGGEGGDAAAHDELNQSIAQQPQEPEQPPPPTTANSKADRQSVQDSKTRHSAGKTHTALAAGAAMGSRDKINQSGKDAAHHPNTAGAAPAAPAVQKSDFRYTPTIVLESTPEDDHEIYKVSIRNFSLRPLSIESLAALLPSCASITTLCFAKCKFTETHVDQLVSILSPRTGPTCHVRTLLLDNTSVRNPAAFARLFNDELALRHLSLRHNGITDDAVRDCAAFLKTNRALATLSLFNNCITSALRSNQNLISLCLGSNALDDAAVFALAKVLGNQPIQGDDLALVRRRLRQMDIDTKNSLKGAKNKFGSSLKLSADAGGAGPGSGGKKQDDAKSKLGKQGSAAAAGAAGAAAAGATGGAASALTPQPPASALSADDKKFARRAPGSALTAGPTSAKPQKTGTPASAHGASLAVPGVAGLKASKKQGGDDDDVSSITTIDTMFEFNRQWFTVGNRVLNNLNLRGNQITEDGVKALLDVVLEQDLAPECSGDALGLFRCSLQGNGFSPVHPWHVELQTLLAARSPLKDIVPNDPALQIPAGSASQPSLDGPSLAVPE